MAVKKYTAKTDALRGRHADILAFPVISDSI